MATPKKPSRAKRARLPSAADAWQKDPDLVRSFLARRPDFEQLCAEVQYILAKRLSQRGIAVAAVTSRAKTLDSFLEKVRRKSYVEPLTDVSDVAGARIVCLYKHDVVPISEIIRSEFEVIEESNTETELDVDQFGYGAQHFIVLLGKTSSGARYDDLKRLQCEVQVRTVLQDAWAIIQHHMVYKRESQVPRQLQRKLNSLAGLFETADDQFDRVRAEREVYLREVQGAVHEPSTFLQSDLNYDTFREFLNWKYPKRPLEKWEGQLRMALDGLLASGYQTLSHLHEALERTEEERDSVREDIPTLKGVPIDQVPSNVEAVLAGALVTPEVAENIPLDEVWRSAIARYRARASSRQP